MAYVLPAARAAEVYALIDQPPPDLLQVILAFSNDFVDHGPETDQ